MRVCSERGLLSRSRGLRIDKARWAVAAQVGDDDVRAVADEARNHMVEAVRVVGNDELDVGKAFAYRARCGTRFGQLTKTGMLWGRAHCATTWLEICSSLPVIPHIRFLRIPDRAGERGWAHVVCGFSDLLGDDIGMAGAAGV